MRRLTCCLAVLALAPAAALADFSYTETSKMTGGALLNMSRSLGAFSKGMRKVGEPTISSVALKGNRMATIHDTHADIYDLDKETITHIDFEKKNYSTITFAQMREAMEKAMKKAQGDMKKADKQRAEAEAKAKESNVQMNMKIDVKDTGKKQIVNGIDTHEILLITGLEATDKKSGASSGAMQTVMSMWMTDSVPGYKEVEEFQKRMAAKMAANWQGSGFAQMGAQMAADPRFKSSVEAMAKEAEKMKGIQIRTVTKMGSNVDLETAGKITDPSSQPPPPDVGKAAGNAAGDAAGNEAQRQTLGRLGGRLGIPGGLGGLGRGRKQKEAPPANPPQQAEQQQGPPPNAVMMEMVSEKSNFSTTSVDAAKFAVPSGFQQIEHPMLKALK
ncbi:MAG: hypothetical protein HY820_27585 [Acidobacteria bacterium]|nr:hypothetical protein [Acidobacteriota bacterium]